jgi:Dolichyl-phosphate-mannose-protein mannosyltransferase
LRLGVVVNDERPGQTIDPSGSIMTAAQTDFQNGDAAIDAIIPREPRPGRAATQRSLDRVGAAIAVIVIAGAVLRLACAGGPLLLDELVSLDHVQPLHHFWEVFWGISDDNNHFLTSLWLYCLDSRTVSAFVLRAPSIAIGVALIPVMAMIARRSGAAAAIAAAALTAFSYFFFNYSIEARGYAGLALAFAVAFDATERCIADPRSRARYVLAAAAGLGALAHLTMLPAIALLALGAGAALWRRNRRIAPTIDAWLRIFVPAASATLPTLAFLYLGALNVGSFKIGALLPFDALLAVNAMATGAIDTFGLPAATPRLIVLVAAGLVVLGALASRAVNSDRKFLYAAIIIGIPAIVFTVRPFNVHWPRYYLAVPLTMILLVADLFGSWWNAGGFRRVAAAAALAAMLVGNAALIGRFQSAQSPNWGDALAIIAASPSPVVATDFEERIGLLARYYNWREGAHVRWVAERDVCETIPDWLLTWSTLDETVPDQIVVGEFCPMSFKLAGRYSGWGLSKIPWALYQRERPGS